MDICPKTGFEITDALKKSYCRKCKDKCEAVQPRQPRFELGEVDGFELGRLLKEKREAEERGKTDDSDALGGKG